MVMIDGDGNNKDDDYKCGDVDNYDNDDEDDNGGVIGGNGD